MGKDHKKPPYVMLIHQVVVQEIETTLGISDRKIFNRGKCHIRRRAGGIEVKGLL